MRLLVACPQCKRQFDAAGKRVGSRFRCHCGAVVTIRQPRGHEAAVVRCSSCGGPREEGGAACRFCGADFTLHEQDLDTVCPQCLARVSDRAKFCHHCGTALAPEPLTDRKTPYVCPACGKLSRLSDRQIGGIALLECGRCAGFWVAAKTFEQLVERSSSNSLGPDWRLPAPEERDATCERARHSGPLYRQCPFCTKLMTRVNYGRRSGVVIDSCKDHGAWFDAEELSRILNWVRSGGLAEAKRRAAAEAERQKKLDQLMRRAGQDAPIAREWHKGDDWAEAPPLIAALVEFAALLFH